mgnify:CR=1 FL=1
MKGQDQLAFIPFLEKLNKNISKKVENIVADAVYEADVTIYECEDCDDCNTNQNVQKPKEIKNSMYQRALCKRD